MGKWSVLITNIHIQAATLNGKPLNKPWICHGDVVKGAKLVLTMGPEPNMKWGRTPEDAPPQGESLDRTNS